MSSDPPPDMKQRMLRGEPYLAGDPELTADRARAQRLLERFNRSSYDEQGLRREVLRDLLGDVGDGVVVNPPFHCDYGTYITIGAGTFVNYGCVLLDVAPIEIGEACQLGPYVQLLTPTHPLEPDLRREGWEGGQGITLGDNVWLGGGVIVCPGVTVGANTVVGAGAVVTRNLPEGVVAVGNPARVARELGS